MFMLEIKKIHSDVRGDVFQVDFAGKQIGVLLSTKKGFMRGGHYHPRRQDMYVVKGKLEFTTTEIDKPDSEKTEILDEGDFVQISPNVVHMMKALEETVFFESMIGGYEAENYEPWRKIIEEKML